jgi:nucleoside-diphosphate-sugar epimerase
VNFVTEEILQIPGYNGLNAWYLDDKPYEAQITLADTSKTLETFKYLTKIGIREGIKKTVESIRKNYDNK